MVTMATILVRVRMRQWWFIQTRDNHMVYSRSSRDSAGMGCFESCFKKDDGEKEWVSGH